MKQAKAKVTLLYLSDQQKNPDFLFALAARTCTSDKTFEKLAEEISLRDPSVITESVIDRGHQSVIEHMSFTFGLEGLSRAATHQLVRHRLSSFSQQSQRYVNMCDGCVVIPPSINTEEQLKIYNETVDKCFESYNLLVSAGVTEEDARYLLPNACETRIVVSMNTRQLLHFFNERLCTKTQWELRHIANLMWTALKSNVDSSFLKYIGPKCQSFGGCIEKEPCGYYHTWKTKKREGKK